MYDGFIREREQGHARHDVAAPQVRLLTTLSQVDAVGPAWRALEASCADPLAYFQTFSWCRNWIARIADRDDAISPAIVTVWKGASLLGVVPLMKQAVGPGLEILKTLGEPHTQYGGMLVTPDRPQRDAVVAALRAVLDKGLGADALVLDMVPETSELTAVISQKYRQPGYHNESSSLDLTQFGTSAAYLAQFEGKQARNRNKRRKRISRYGELRLRAVWPGDKEFPVLVDQCVEMKRRWLAETGRVSQGFAITGYAEFLSSLDGDPADREGAVAFVFEAGDRRVAIELSMIRAGHLYAYIGGFDWSLRNMSPGKVQMEATICWAIDNGLKAYDLLGNPAAYKQSWSSQTCELFAYCRAYTLKGTLFSGLWQPYLRPALKRAYYGLPFGLRTSRLPGIAGGK